MDMVEETEEVVDTTLEEISWEREVMPVILEDMEERESSSPTNA